MCVYIYPRGPRFSDGEAVGLGGVGWGMVASCYVAATLMRPLGYICKYIYIDICIYIFIDVYRA